jgi:hypothetical protein
MRIEAHGGKDEEEEITLLTVDGAQKISCWCQVDV